MVGLGPKVPPSRKGKFTTFLYLARSGLEDPRWREWSFRSLVGVETIARDASVSGVLAGVQLLCRAANHAPVTPSHSSKRLILLSPCCAHPLQNAIPTLTGSLMLLVASAPGHLKRHKAGLVCWAAPTNIPQAEGVAFQAISIPLGKAHKV